MYKSGISFNRKMEGRISLFGVEDDPVVLGLEPLHGVVLDELLRGADASRLPPAVAHVGAGSAQHDVEVHAIDADRRVVLDAKIDVLLDPEPEVAVHGEVITTELVLAHLKTEFENISRPAYIRHTRSNNKSLVLSGKKDNPISDQDWITRSFP